MTKAQELDAATRGEGCLGRSQDDEPVFILCARDRFAAGVVRTWADRVSHEHGHTAKTDEAFAHADRMDA